MYTSSSSLHSKTVSFSDCTKPLYSDATPPVVNFYTVKTILGFTTPTARPARSATLFAGRPAACCWGERERARERAHRLVSRVWYMGPRIFIWPAGLVLLLQLRLSGESFCQKRRQMSIPSVNSYEQDKQSNTHCCVCSRLNVSGTNIWKGKQKKVIHEDDWFFFHFFFLYNYWRARPDMTLGIGLNMWGNPIAFSLKLHRFLQRPTNKALQQGIPLFCHRLCGQFVCVLVSVQDFFLSQRCV